MLDFIDSTMPILRKSPFTYLLTLMPAQFLSGYSGTIAVAPEFCSLVANTSYMPRVFIVGVAVISVHLKIMRLL